MKNLQQISGTELEAIREWCKVQPLEKITGSSYVKGRLEKWYRMGSNLQSTSTGRGKVFSCPDSPGFINSIGNQHLPGWNSLLVCGGPTDITWHRDHTHFFGPAVMINLGEAIYIEAPRHTDLKAAGGLTLPIQNLKDGMVVLIDTKLPHSAHQLSEERFNLTFRTIKPEYL